MLSHRFYLRDGNRFITVLSSHSKADLSNITLCVYVIIADNGVPYFGMCWKESILDRLKGHFNTPYFREICKADRKIASQTKSEVKVKVLYRSDCVDELREMETTLLVQYMYDKCRTIGGIIKRKILFPNLLGLFNYSDTKNLVLNSKIESTKSVCKNYEKIVNGEFSNLLDF